MGGLPVDVEVVNQIDDSEMGETGWELKGDATLLIGVLCLKCSRNYRLEDFLFLNAKIKGKRPL